MDLFAIATATGLILDGDDCAAQRQRRKASPRRFPFIATLLALVIIASVIALSGCASSTQSSSAPGMTPIYQSPYGPRVYKVDGPDGPEVVTVVPGHQPPTGGRRTYHIIQQP